MKRLFTICMILSSCLNLGFAQGIRGSVKLSGRAAIVTTGHSVTLSWKATQGADELLHLPRNYAWRPIRKDSLGNHRNNLCRCTSNS